MYQKRLSKFLKRTGKDTGFTLTELLTGLIMSIFVTGALGFGLIQVLNLTRRGSEQANARNEANRAIEFISDELKRSQNIELSSNVSTAGFLSTPASGFTLPSGATARLALQMPGVTQRIVYYVSPPPTGSSWKGPLVLYRWGPNFSANGSYTDPDDTSGWGYEALIDGLDNTNQTASCGAGTVTYQGFFACVVDDDGDTIVEDGTTDTNGDGTIDIADSVDVDGFGQTAELFLIGGVDTIANNGSDVDETVTASTQAIARAKVADVDNTAPSLISPITMRSLEADYTCHPEQNAAGNPISPGEQPKTWATRIDLDNSAVGTDGRGNAIQWVHEEGRQAQPINIDPANPINIYAIPLVASGCLNDDRGNPGAEKNTIHLGTVFLVSAPKQLSEKGQISP